MFSSTNTGVILLFFTGITFGTLAMFTFHQYELGILETERVTYRKLAEEWRAAYDREAKERTYQAETQRLLRVAGAGRRLNTATGQQKAGVGWTGIAQTIVAGPGGVLWRVWSGNFINGTDQRIEGISVVISAQTAGVTEFGAATMRAEGPAMGICAGKNLFCAQPEAALVLGGIAACADDAALQAFVQQTLSRPRVRTSVEAGKELPFTLVQRTQLNQLIPDHLVSVTFTTGAIPRKVVRSENDALNGGKKRRIRKRRRGRRRGR
jgi:hypothetical protein